MAHSDHLEDGDAGRGPASEACGARWVELEPLVEQRLGTAVEMT